MALGEITHCPVGHGLPVSTSCPWPLTTHLVSLPTPPHPDLGHLHVELDHHPRNWIPSPTPTPPHPTAGKMRSEDSVGNQEDKRLGVGGSG